MLPSLTSCDSFSSKINGIYNTYLLIDTNSGDYIIDLSAEELITYIEGDLDFPLYFYSKNCSTCNLVSQHLKKYCSDNKITFYGFDYASNMNDYQLLLDYNDEIFKREIVTPRVLLFSEKNLKIEVNSTKFSSYSLFSKTLNSFIYETNLYSVSDFETLKYLDSYGSNYVCFTFKNTNQLTIFNQTLKEYIHPEQLPIYLLDYNKVLEEDKELIESFFQNQIVDTCIFKNSAKPLFKYVNYETNFDEFQNSLISFFRSNF